MLLSTLLVGANLVFALNLMFTLQWWKIWANTSGRTQGSPLQMIMTSIKLLLKIVHLLAVCVILGIVLKNFIF